jgi:hypothetical protein
VRLVRVSAKTARVWAHVVTVVPRAVSLLRGPGHEQAVGRRTSGQLLQLVEVLRRQQVTSVALAHEAVIKHVTAYSLLRRCARVGGVVSRGQARRPPGDPPPAATAARTPTCNCLRLRRTAQRPRACIQGSGFRGLDFRV